MPATPQPRAASPLGLIWFELQDYQKARSLMKDGELFPPSYEVWRETARVAQVILERQGVAVRPVRLEPNAFLAFCEQEGLEPDADARNDYANRHALRNALP